jgi:hypothetical protein
VDVVINEVAKMQGGSSVGSDMQPDSVDWQGSELEIKGNQTVGPVGVIESADAGAIAVSRKQATITMANTLVRSFTLNSLCMRVVCSLKKIITSVFFDVRIFELKTPGFGKLVTVHTEKGEAGIEQTSLLKSD